MKSITVSREQRFDSETNPCPICGGGQDLTGEERCFGYRLRDDNGSVCTNVESDHEAPDADGWLHFDADEAQSVRVNVRPIRSPRGDSERLTLAALARSKALPTRALRNLGCREVGRSVQIGAKLRHAGSPKYTWVEGRSPKTDPLFPMPGQVVEEQIDITAGETDAITLRHVGRCAFGITSGEKRSGSSLTVGHYRDLRKRGAQEVTIWGDGDEHGQDWLRQEAAAARSAGLRVLVGDLSPLYDHFGAGVKDLNELWQSLDGDADAFRTALVERTREFTQVRIYTLDELRTLATEDVPYLVTDFLSPGEKMGLTGPPKNFKTWIALNLAAAVATGGRFLQRAEWQVPEPRPVLVVEEEGDTTKFAQRVERAFREVKSADVHLIPKMGFSLLDRAQVDWLIERVQERDAGLLILDPWQRLIVGADEDKAKETGPAWDEVHRITVECPECAVVVLHHANKAGGLTLNAIRGSSRFAGEVDLSMIVKVHEPGVIHASLEGRDVPSHMTDEGYLEIRYEVHDPFAMSALGFTVNVPSAGRPSKRSAVEDLFRSHPDAEFTASDGARAAGIAVSTFSKNAHDLVKRGVLEQNGRKFRLSEGEQS